ncbi:EAL domain-containing protein [Arcobacteraceae bacterium]|nr:EAL domain-containing protein [Arcobacteraceae bacterium]
MINNLIQNNKIEIFFQPIISIKDKKIFAMEALTRAYDEEGNFISPIYLFDEAKKANESNLLDSYIRELALIKFSQYHEENKEILLFLNFESSFIASKEYDTFLLVVKKHNINPSNIVLEIKEDEIKSNDAIEKFVKLYREHGFIIAIDDFGTGYSSFDRLSLIKPDIVKIDRSLICDVNDNFINSEILTALSNMCHNIGALVLAEGVESQKEILKCLNKDIDIYQGFYFAKPQSEITEFVNNNIFALIDDIGKRYTENISTLINNKKAILEKSKELIDSITSTFNQKDIEHIPTLKNIIEKNNQLEAIYTIDYHTGLQKDDTIINIEKSTLFIPSKNNHDHNLKEYYFIAKNSSRHDYLSTTYVSKASGNICRTYSSIVQINNVQYILCIDIKTQ